MKLKLNYEISISSQNEALFPIIATTMGWTPSEGGLTALEYLKSQISSDIENYFKNRIEESHLKYTGISGASARAVLLSDLKANSICSVDFSND